MAKKLYLKDNSVNPVAIKKTFQYGQNTVTLETGRIARQATGAVLITIGNTSVLCTAVAKKDGKFTKEIVSVPIKEPKGKEQLFSEDEFIREAKNADVAIQSAHQDVLKTLPQAQLIEAAPDYAGLTDIAEIVSVSRQQMRKIYEQADSFPTPLHTGKSAIWHLAEVLDWLKENKDYSFDEQTHEIARASAKLNFTSRNNKTAHTPNNYSKTAKLIGNISYPINALFSEKSITPSVLEAA